jgi:hypothetical protein
VLKNLRRVAGMVGIVVAIVLVTVGVYYIAGLHPSQTSSCAAGTTSTVVDAQPIQSPPLVLEYLMNSTHGPNHWYNFSVAAATSCAMLGLLSLRVVLPTGANVTLPPASGVAMVNASESVEATFVFGVGWSFGAGYSSTSVLTTQDELSIFYVGSTSASLAGDFFIVQSASGTPSASFT